jgi:hypothetical protein
MNLPVRGKLVCVNGEWKTIALNAEHPNLELLRVKIKDRNKDKERIRVEREKKASIVRTCGNCKRMRYQGVNVIKMEWGNCDAWKITDRFSNRPTDPGCDQWIQRPTSKAIRELMNSDEKTERLRMSGGRRR